MFNIDFFCDKILIECIIQNALTSNYKYAGYNKSFSIQINEIYFITKYKLFYLIKKFLMSKYTNNNIIINSKNKND
jgi:hypothetical protein